MVFTYHPTFYDDYSLNSTTKFLRNQAVTEDNAGVLVRVTYFVYSAGQRNFIRFERATPGKAKRGQDDWKEEVEVLRQRGIEAIG